jgi:triphosphoribosyl-dephospho-CoA synthase
MSGPMIGNMVHPGKARDVYEESSHRSVRRARPRASAVTRFIARQALRALYAELALYPKPGLVSLRDAGAHRDMDAGTFFRSLFALRQYFVEMAMAGVQSAAFSELRTLGLLAEARMMRATGGVNTHRGAIFVMGILVACAGAALVEARSLDDAELQAILRVRWGRDLEEHAASRKAGSHGRAMAQRYGVVGAAGEAVLGFPSVFNIGLVALRDALAQGADMESAQLHAFFSLLAIVDDTNVLYRGGSRGLARVKRGARTFLERGSVFTPGAFSRAESLHRAFSRDGLSPGGSADLFAATWFVHLLQTTTA